MSHEQNLELLLAANACLLPSRDGRRAERERLRRAVEAVGDDALAPQLTVLRGEALRYLSDRDNAATLQDAVLRYAESVRQDDDIIGRVRCRRPGRPLRRAWLTGVAASAQALEGDDAR